MHGNVAEFCVDEMAEYTRDAVVDPCVDPGSSPRFVVVRGGAWCQASNWATSAVRLCYPPDDHLKSIGLRVVRPIHEN
jgi:formylglycine-generating enzyme required for sulfatase activity